MAKAEDERTLLIATSDGKYRVNIPSSWKVTFGVFAAGSGPKSYGGDSTAALRIYESEKQQRPASATSSGSGTFPSPS